MYHVHGIYFLPLPPSPSPSSPFNNPSIEREGGGRLTMGELRLTYNLHAKCNATRNQISSSKRINKQMAKLIWINLYVLCTHNKRLNALETGNGKRIQKRNENTQCVSLCVVDSDKIPSTHRAIGHSIAEPRRKQWAHERMVSISVSASPCTYTQPSANNNNIKRKKNCVYSESTKIQAHTIYP